MFRRRTRPSGRLRGLVLAAVVNTTVAAGENLTVGTSSGCRLRAFAPGGDSFHRASSTPAEGWTTSPAFPERLPRLRAGGGWLALRTHYRAGRGTSGMMSKYLLFSHTQSSSSVSATNSQENRAVHGFLYAFASSIVT
jgi:hypothetical protein